MYCCVVLLCIELLVCYWVDGCAGAQRATRALPLYRARSAPQRLLEIVVTIFDDVRTISALLNDTWVRMSADNCSEKLTGIMLELFKIENSFQHEPKYVFSHKLSGYGFSNLVNGKSPQDQHLFVRTKWVFGSPRSLFQAKPIRSDTVNKIVV